MDILLSIIGSTAITWFFTRLFFKKKQNKIVAENYDLKNSDEGKLKVEFQELKAEHQKCKRDLEDIENSYKELCSKLKTKRGVAHMKHIFTVTNYNLEFEREVGFMLEIVVLEETDDLTKVEIIGDCYDIKLDDSNSNSIKEKLYKTYNYSWIPSELISYYHSRLPEEEIQ
jgi:hypothetical protein